MKQPSSVSISLLEHCPEHIGSDPCQGSEITGNALCGGDIFPEYTHCFLQGIYVPDAQRHMRFVNYFRYLLTNFAGKKISEPKWELRLSTGALQVSAWC